jgi:putative oxidoreductase
MHILQQLFGLHRRFFGAVENALQGWFPGLFARFAFAAVLLFYFWNSFRTKVGEGVAGFFSISDNAYYQIVPKAMEAAGLDSANVAFFPWKLMVYAGTYAEFILPLLVVIGLFTRIAALGMIAFVLVQSYVDITQHQVDAETTGAWFDRLSDSAIMDQRLMWMVPLAYLVVKGAGWVSLDKLFLERAANNPAAESGIGYARPR